MDKHFICLANSLKRGGRCIAGIEVKIDEQGHWEIVRNSNSTPHWIRPIDPCTDFGEISELSAQPIHLLSIVKLTNVNPCPQEAHSEDVFCNSMEPIGDITPTTSILDELIDNVHTEIFYNHGVSISQAEYANGDYSLMLIHPDHISVVPDPLKERAKYRMQITYRGTIYEMSVTDPNYLDYLRENMRDGGYINNAYLCLSLGLEYECRHHKLVTGVVIPHEHINSVPFSFIRRKVSRKTVREVRSLTWKERLSIKSALYIPSYKGCTIYIRKWNGHESFLPLEGEIELKARTKIRLNQVMLVTYEDEEGCTTHAFRWK